MTREGSVRTTDSAQYEALDESVGTTLNALGAGSLIAVGWFLLSRLLARLTAVAPAPRDIDNRRRGDFPLPTGPINVRDLPFNQHHVPLDHL